MAIHVEVEDLLLYDLWIFTFERVTLVEDVVNAATESPNVDFVAKATLFKDELRGWVIYMATEVTSSQQLFEVIR